MKLVIAEKPSVAKTIAKVVGATESCNGYFKGNGYLVSYCFGHLVTLAGPDEYDEKYKKWAYETLPIIPSNWKLKLIENDGSKAQFKTLEKLMKQSDVDTIVCATDAGREGELIFRYVVQLAGCTKPIERLWTSSLEDKAIAEGFEKLKPGADYENLYKAAMCRSYADWLFGMNFTRLFTCLYGARKPLNIGRVQTPTLAMICNREVEIRGFKPTPFYRVHLLCDGMDAVTEKIEQKEEAEFLLAAVTGAQAKVESVEDQQKKVAPPKLYDLTSLQRDANKLFGFTAKKTLDIAQSLYEKQLTTYPRTDSQYLTDDMADTCDKITQIALSKLRLKTEDEFVLGNSKALLNSKKVTDHHAIIPTEKLESANLESLPDDEAKILLTIASRLVCAQGMDHIYSQRSVVIECAGVPFKASGKGIIANGWKDYEEAFRLYMGLKKQDSEDKKDDGTTDSANINLTQGQIFMPDSTSLSDHMTKAPARYTEASLLAAMERVGAKEMSDEVERKGLGTPATRADTIEHLVKNGFIERSKKNLVPTEDGLKLITIVPEMLKTPSITVEWENALVDVAAGQMRMDDFMDGICNTVKSLVGTYSSVKDEDKALFKPDVPVLGACPKCGGNVFDGKYGAYCASKCGMTVSRVRGQNLSPKQVKALLEGKKILMKGLPGKKGSYDAYFVPDGIEEFSYTNKAGESVSGWQFKTQLEFAKKW